MNVLDADPNDLTGDNAVEEAVEVDLGYDWAA